jgi:hypothetical protein
MSFEGLVTQFKQINPTIYKKPWTQKHGHKSQPSNWSTNQKVTNIITSSK